MGLLRASPFARRRVNNCATPIRRFTAFRESGKFIDRERASIFFSRYFSSFFFFFFFLDQLRDRSDRAFFSRTTRDFSSKVRGPPRSLRGEIGRARARARDVDEVDAPSANVRAFGSASSIASFGRPIDDSVLRIQRGSTRRDRAAVKTSSRRRMGLLGSHRDRCSLGRVM